MKYTFINKRGNQQTVEIDDAWIKTQRINLGISNQEAINMWLSDEGYIENEIVNELTAKAKGNPGMRVEGKKERKKPQRKPDYIKRALVSFIYNALDKGNVEDYQLENIQVVNQERVISFSIKDDNYELTLSKKRKPKT